VHCRIA